MDMFFMVKEAIEKGKRYKAYPVIESYKAKNLFHRKQMVFDIAPMTKHDMTERSSDSTLGKMKNSDNIDEWMVSEINDLKNKKKIKNSDILNAIIKPRTEEKIRQRKAIRSHLKRNSRLRMDMVKSPVSKAVEQMSNSGAESTSSFAGETAAKAMKKYPKGRVALAAIIGLGGGTGLGLMMHRKQKKQADFEEGNHMDLIEKVAEYKEVIYKEAVEKGKKYKARFLPEEESKKIWEASMRGRHVRKAEANGFAKHDFLYKHKIADPAGTSAEIKDALKRVEKMRKKMEFREGFKHGLPIGAGVAAASALGLGAYALGKRKGEKKQEAQKIAEEKGGQEVDFEKVAAYKDAIYKVAKAKEKHRMGDVSEADLARYKRNHYYPQFGEDRVVPALKSLGLGIGGGIVGGAAGAIAGGLTHNPELASRISGIGATAGAVGLPMAYNENRLKSLSKKLLNREPTGGQRALVHGSQSLLQFPLSLMESPESNVLRAKRNGGGKIRKHAAEDSEQRHGNDEYKTKFWRHRFMPHIKNIPAEIGGAVLGGGAAAGGAYLAAKHKGITPEMAQLLALHAGQAGSAVGAFGGMALNNQRRLHNLSKDILHRKPTAGESAKMHAGQILLPSALPFAGFFNTPDSVVMHAKRQELLGKATRKKKK